MTSNFSIQSHICRKSLISSLIILSLGLSGCTQQHYRKPRYAKIEDLSCYNCSKRAIHIVDRGESLYSIAFGYGRDFRKLAAVNRIAYPYRIYPGQKIYLNQTVSRNNKTSNKIYKNNRQLAVTAPNVEFIDIKPIENQSVTNIVWEWPIRGKINANFDDKNSLNKGIDITVNNTKDVNAAANGVVVYHGSGLKGYGKLIIIKHSDEYLSAYAHNDELKVIEGQKVSKGQKIASVGQNARNFHFEIRKNGKPVNPLAYLPS